MGDKCEKAHKEFPYKKLTPEEADRIFYFCSCVVIFLVCSVLYRNESTVNNLCNG